MLPRLRVAVAADGFRAFVRLVFIALYSLAFIAAGFGQWSPTTSMLLYVLVSILWIVLLAIYIRDILLSANRRGYALHHPAIPMLLIAPLFLLLYWDAVWFILVIAAYILELRQHSAGNAFTFSVCLIVFVGVLAALAMSELENDVARSPFQSPTDSILWAFGSLLRINTGKTLNPSTADGQFLAVVVQVSAILAASLFTAKLIAWVIGSSGPIARSVIDDERGATEPDPVRAEIAELRAAIIRLTDTVEGGRQDAPDDPR